MIFAISVEYDDDEASPVTVVLRSTDNKAALQAAISAAMDARPPTHNENVKSASIVSQWDDKALEDGGKLVF